MTIESNNRSGELVPSDEVTSLIQYSLAELDLNAECEVSLTFVDEAEMNVFKTLFNNAKFWIIILGEFALQSYMVYIAVNPLGSALLGTAPLSQN